MFRRNKMKRYIKILTNILAVLLLAIACVSMTGCKKEDIKTATLKLQLYDFGGNKFYTESEVTMTIDLFGHLAPKTVEAVSKYINEGYYNNAIFYQMDVNGVKQIMVGNLLIDGDSVVADADGNVNIKLNSIKPTLPGEFTNGGVVGSDLLNTKGSVGLWRDWNSNSDYTYSTGVNTGRATWFMLDAPQTRYDGCFCVFGQFNLEDTANVTAFDALTKMFSTSDNYDEYKVFYTGEYDPSKPNCGLTFHCTTKERFTELKNLTEEEKENLSAEEREMANIFDSSDEKYDGVSCLYSYDSYTIRVPKNKDGKVSAVIKSASVTDKK